MKNIINLNKLEEDFAAPNFDDFFRHITFVKFLIFLIILLIIYALTGIYIVQPDEVGVIRRFGRAVRVEGPGLHYRLPWPIERVDKPKVHKIRRAEIGYYTIPGIDPPEYRDIKKESHMLTGDENIISVWLTIQYKIKNAKDYLFNIRDPEKTVRNVAEASLRQAVGSENVDAVLTTGKARIQAKIEELLQKTLDKYKSGIQIRKVQLQDVHPPEEVQESFKDVASAKEDKSRLINEAEAYENEILPKARGTAAQMTQEAMAYRIRKINIAKGESERFLKILKEYRNARNITKLRLYIETLEKVLKPQNKYIIDQEIFKVFRILKGGEQE